VHQLADILLEVQPLDADPARTAAAADLEAAVLGSGSSYWLI